ncbi:hypothetical protein [Nocardia xishanensis]
MGQYYRAVLLADDGTEITGYLPPWDYGPSLKLMEHSWLGNEFVQAVERVLTSPTRLVWAGDYADSEPGSTSNLFHKTETATKIPSPGDVPVGRYVINHDKRTYVDKTTVVANAVGLAIHPLPVLTVEGNGRGGGDLREGSVTGDITLVGTWARDRITVADTVPDGYQALEFDLIEPW